MEWHSTKKFPFFFEKSLPSAHEIALGKEILFFYEKSLSSSAWSTRQILDSFFNNFFAECHVHGPRQIIQICQVP
jgi:hypothetical protein